MFRGKESSNRIKLSLFVQELFNFGVFSSLQLWGVGGGWMGVGGGWGMARGRHLGVGVVGWCPHTHAHARARMHAHACTHMHVW